MKELLKDYASNVGVAIPFIVILWFSNPTLFRELTTLQLFLLCIGIAICKDLVVWGLKK